MNRCAEAVIVNMNPGMDRWLTVKEKSSYEGVVQAQNVQSIVSGKGTNLVRALKQLGCTRYYCLNILGGHIGEMIDRKFSEEGFLYENFQVTDESRINFTVIHESAEYRMQTFNEPGPVLHEGEAQEFLECVRKTLAERKRACLVFSGSAPEGISGEDLGNLACWAEENGNAVIADIGARWLDRMLESPMELLKVNRQEFFHAVSVDSADTDAVRKFMDANRIRNVIVTDGKNGSKCWDSNGSCFEIAVKDHPHAVGFTVGCGDSFLAGYLSGYLKGDSFLESCLLANACGIANTIRFGPAVFSASEAEDCRKYVTLVNR